MVDGYSMYFMPIPKRSQQRLSNTGKESARSVNLILHFVHILIVFDSEGTKKRLVGLQFTLY